MSLVTLVEARSTPAAGGEQLVWVHSLNVHDDLTLAELAGQALGRIRLQQARIELATAVQRSMLPTLPERPSGLEVAARYQPCRAGLDIGGDWYDAFLMPAGSVHLQIGDAQGHDVDAAAYMGAGARRHTRNRQPRAGPRNRADAHQSAARRDGRTTVRQPHHAAH
ncbi:hypothetical protein [Streptomyces sp. NPDC052107]|uniref:PP2C family protein-serine/threonine phosphatase n=1 Tax=Streptomyces sp. NPDC052107 TaxID=3155632 RepID=UPI00343D6A8D